MKGLICVLILTLNYTSFSQSYPHLYELRGLEDLLGNTHLFYRYGKPGGSLNQCWNKSIYHFNLLNNVDTLFITDVGYYNPFVGGCDGVSVSDYEFFNNEPIKYIYCGGAVDVDPVPIIIRFDGQAFLSAFGGVYNIEISQQDENLLYAGLTWGQLFKSTDGGYNWTVGNDSLAWINYAMVSLSKNDDTKIYGIDDNKLVRSEDEGQSYIIVDDSEWRETADLYYDPDGKHIYGTYNYREYLTQKITSKLFVSNDNGNPFTWTNVITNNLPIRFTHDELQSGEIYYSLQRNIYKSTDYTNTFEHYKQLDRNITGLYKKSGTDILYASTPLKIYEITPDTIQVFKSLPIPSEIFSFYPLSIGNMWVYSQQVHEVWTGNIIGTYFLRYVIGDTILTNNQRYYKVVEYDAYINTESVFYERIDSTNGLVYRYTEDSTQSNNEFLIEDFLAEIGDSIANYRISHYSEGPPNQVIYIEDNIFDDFDLLKNRKVYSEVYYTGSVRHSLTKDIGLDSLIIDRLDVYTSFIDLKGCIIDGVVYGDTTVVFVDDVPPQPYSFSLSQNYPNPFNPVTKIRYTVGGYPPSIYPANIPTPVVDHNIVQLKVYGILGNEIITLVNEEKSTGTYEVEFDGTGLPSGIYFYRFTAGNYSATKKMLLLK